MMIPRVLLLVLLLFPVNGDKLSFRRDHDADADPGLGAEAMKKPDQEHRSLRHKKGQDSEVCVGLLQYFEKSFLLKFVDVPGQLDTDQIKVLEESFLITSNRLEEDLCDKCCFRKVIYVVIGEQQQRRLTPNPFDRDLHSIVQQDSTFIANIVIQDNAPFGETPTAEPFIVNYNYVLREIAGDTLDNEITLDSLTELEEVSCEEEVDSLQTLLQTEFFGNPDQVSAEQLEVLAQSVMETYNGINGLNEQTCDLLFREVLFVTSKFETTQTRRELFSPAFAAGNRTEGAAFVDVGNTVFVNNTTQPVVCNILVIFDVIFQCRGCGSGTPLLTDDAPRRLFQLDRHLHAEGCQCPVGVEEFRSPSRDEFDVAFNQTVTFLIDQDEIQFVAAVGETAEVEEISCPVQVDRRQTRLLIEAEGDQGAVSDSDITTLEETAKETLLDLFSQFCDPEVRNVLDVQFVDFGPARSRELHTELFNSTSRPFLLSFTIVFSCRGCPPDASLFGNDASRRLLPSNDKDRGASARRLQSNGDPCFCDINVFAARPPTETEFEILFQAAVLDADLTTNVTIASATETETTPAPVAPTQAPVTPTQAPITPTLAPITPTPTQAPITPTPTQAPTQAPITPTPSPTNLPVPTPAPSTTPSDGPTNGPTDTNAPSLSPSASPSVPFPTPAPSPTPSNSPTNGPTENTPSLSPSIRPSAPFPTPAPSPSPSYSPSFAPTFIAE